MSREQKRVLVVEDEAGTRTFLQDALRDEGFDVLTAHDGHHALRVVAAGRPDLILLDFGLPVLSGEAFAAEWRHRRPSDRIPIIGISALPDGASIARRLELDGFLAKPLDVEQVIAAVREHLPDEAVAT
ncbi:MAG TPA: response regulator [Candidatus Limnocylindria bacterium]|nr:response regulator [Candidatus Limnocylindria bacterium]